METFFQGLFGLLILLGFFALLGTFLYLRFRRKRTRENFAFVALFTISILLVNAIALMTDMWRFIELITPFRDNSTINVRDTQSLIFLIILILTGMIYFLYKNWTGAISTREAKAKELGNYKGNLFLDARYGRPGNLIEIYERQAINNKREIFQPVNIDRLPWHIRAGQLLRLNDRKYHIDLGDYDPYTRGVRTEQDNQYKEPNTGEDWYQKYSCFISKYGDKAIAIYCCEKIPRQNVINRLIKDMGDKFEKILVVMEDNDRYEPLEVSPPHQLEYHYQYEMLRSLVDFSDYKNWLHRQFHKKKLPNSERTLNDIYVPQKAAHYTPQSNSEYLKKGDPIENAEQYVLDWANNPTNSNEHLVIVGEYGQGKSVLSLKIALEMLSDPEKYKRIPIIIELRGTSPRNRDALDILGKFATENGLKAQALYQLHRAGKLLIILEGFDEMDLVGDTEMLMQHFQQLWQLAREPQCRIIITGRPNLFMDDPQRQQALGITLPRTHLPYTQAILLEMMDTIQIEAALKSADIEVKKGILVALVKEIK